MASSRRNFLKGSLGMLAASAQQRNPAARPQETLAELRSFLIAS
jgi:hypothetical protein